MAYYFIGTNRILPFHSPYYPFGESFAMNQDSLKNEPWVLKIWDLYKKELERGRDNQ